MLNISNILQSFGLSQKLGNKPVFLFFYFLFAFSTSAQQNLVPNGDFEDYVTCPDWSNYYVDAAANWFIPTNNGTSDYFNSCSTEFDVEGLLFSVPENFSGWQEAHSGNGYAGFSFSMYNDGSSYCEYISIELNQTLKKGSFYELSFFVSVADSFFASYEPNIYVNKLGAYFSSNAINQNNNFIIDVVPQFESDPNAWLSDSIGWQYVSGIFTTSGTEKFMTIGNFAKYNELKTNYLYPGPFLDKGTYYYIDDISLVEVELSLPNVFTPNGDSVNDVLELPFLPTNAKLVILNRWGEKVFETHGMNTQFWDGKYNGENATEGTYFYILNIDTIKKTGFIQLVR